MALVIANSYRLIPGDTNEGTLEFPDDREHQLAIEIVAHGFQFNVDGATSASNPTHTTTSGNKVIITVPRGNKLNYKANNASSEAFISW